MKVSVSVYVRKLYTAQRHLERCVDERDLPSGMEKECEAAKELPLQSRPIAVGPKKGN